MSSPGTNTVRLVIQRAQEERPSRAGYRVVAYPAPKGMVLKPAKFSSREELIQRLRAAIPDLDEKQVGSGVDTQVVFAGDIELTSAQLVALGLAR